ncbi:MAG: bifunctional aconitate hydratase 2/2-methylisocitrate dehydratase [Planctomycetes bacterium]|nr:bifunctional aconitate hydratase 2/2-methylisocitrate dehydratase [Planctomycetota bacterium]
MLATYRTATLERSKLGIPPLPLTAEQTAEVCKLLEAPPAGEQDFLIGLLTQRISPGVDPAAKVKARWLGSVAHGEVKTPVVSREQAIVWLGTMLGGYNIPFLMRELEGPHAAAAAQALKHTILIFDNFAVVAKLAEGGNLYAKAVIQSWADGEWFSERSALPEAISGVVMKVPGETNTDDLSPAQQASSRPDIPLHALSMYELRNKEFLAQVRAMQAAGKRVIIAGDVYGTGSSRKSATNSVMWATGSDIPFIPNKRSGGVVLGSIIAPIFLDTFRDAGGLPVVVDVSRLETGDQITIKPRTGELLKNGQAVASFSLRSASMADEFRAGGRTNLIIGRALTERARGYLGLGISELFAKPEPTKDNAKGYTLAQKMVGRACGVRGVRPGVSCEPRMTTVGSQDTTGPMTADELKELACLRFSAELVMQSFCHTAAYPKEIDAKMHRWLPEFIVERNGVALRPGDGIIHSWLNRMCLPDTVGTGGDSHTRFPIGISFPAGSGLVAFAAAIGFMPLDMPESVLVRFRGKLQPGVTLRDLVNAIPWVALQSGDLTLEKKGKKNVFSGRILEIEGLEHLTCEQAFELSDASAERSAAACAVNLSEKSVAEYLRSNVELLKSMIADGYGAKETLERRISAMEEWLKNPVLLRADADAEYAKVYEIDLATITEPLIACPNDPDRIKSLSEVANEPIDEVFVGSCMTNIGHFRALANVYKHTKVEYLKPTTWICPPTRMDEAVLMQEGHYGLFGKVGARREIPGCSLCMGNQARCRPASKVFSTSTRNFDGRMGRDAQVYLGSAELAAVVSILGRLPTKDEYLEHMKKCIDPFEKSIYKYMDFSQMSARMPDFKAAHGTAH